MASLQIYLTLFQNLLKYYENSFAQKIVSHAVYTGAFPTSDSQYRALRDSQITKRTEYDVQRRWTKLNKMHAHSLFEQPRAVMDLLPLDQHQRSLWQQIRNESAQRLARMEILHDQGDHPAVAGMALEACRGLQQARWRTWKSTSDLFPSVTSSPLCVSFETLPEHWNLVQRLQRRSWGENLLVAGNCEDLDTMRQAGWRHFQGDQVDVESLVELSHEDPHGGQLCLQMKAWPVGVNSPNVPLTAAAWIQTAPIEVHPGDQVRIHGWVKTTSAPNDRHTCASDCPSIFDAPHNTCE